MVTWHFKEYSLKKKSHLKNIKDIFLLLINIENENNDIEPPTAIPINIEIPQTIMFDRLTKLLQGRTNLSI